MLSINFDDVIGVLKSCAPYLIFFGVVLILGIITLIVGGKLKKPKRKLVRSQTGIAILLALIIAVNLICFIPMSSLISLATGNGTIQDETSAEATQLCIDIAKEGIVLLQNEDSILPLKNSENLNVFGWASTNPCYGGTGSGSLSDAYETETLLSGLLDAGYNLNTELSDFYTSYRADRPEVGMFAQDWTLPEPTADSYSDALLAGAKEFSDTALVVITRVGGEGADIPTDVSKVNYTDNSDDYKDFEVGEHYLQLSRTEKDMVELVCDNFDNVIFVYNGANAMELAFVNDYSQIKGVIWCPGTGQSGFKALGEIVHGEVNPSGKTSDTFIKDLTLTPVYNNIGKFNYTNMDEFASESFGEQTLPSFVNYVEGIYVGYRFYETAADEGLIKYEDEVLYPFGFGLSYSTFKQTMGKMTESNGQLSFDVTVENTGNVGGKDVVEIYYNPPYTNGGVEKSTANLIAFDKTDELAPGESQTIPISFSIEEMASYDSSDQGGYVLESGDYGISLRTDSHTIVEEQTYTLDSEIRYDDGRSSDAIVATNQFSDAIGEATYLSRADAFANYDIATAAPKSFSMPEEYKSEFVTNINYNPEDFNDNNDEMPVTGAKNGLTANDLRGVDYEDPQWEDLLDQLTVGEMDSIISLGGYQTPEISSIGLVQTINCDGPASINNNFTGTGSIGFPSAIMIASTWNHKLASAFGESIGKMAAEMGVSGWYAPAMNTHRSAFAGRNFEYYSEDGFLAGTMAAKAVLGAEKEGVFAFIKHFALNDQEDNRNSMLCTWSEEQPIREIYLKPFEMAVKEGGAKAAMSSFNFIGTTYAGANPQLLNIVLRDEWGFRGFVLTDYFGVYGYQNADQEVRNGNDIMLVPYETETNHVKDQKSATSIKAMRQSTKNIIYTVVNSRSYSPEVLDMSTPTWKIVAVVIDVLLGLAIIALEVAAIKKYRRRTTEIDTLGTEPPISLK
ncbi:glycoside hydrolase family 3 C-terminal domain-containing protein [Lachnospiraceae bacterium ZAX-1]